MSVITRYEAAMERDYNRMIDAAGDVQDIADDLLMQAEYDWTDAEAISMALSETKGLQPQALQQALIDGDLMLAGEILKHISMTYWENRAQKDAEKIYRSAA